MIDSSACHSARVPILEFVTGSGKRGAAPALENKAKQSWLPVVAGPQTRTPLNFMSYQFGARDNKGWYFSFGEGTYSRVRHK